MLITLIRQSVKLIKFVPRLFATQLLVALPAACIVTAGCDQRSSTSKIGTWSVNPSKKQIIGRWTYVTETGRGIGRMTFYEDGSYFDSFDITTSIGTSASSNRGTWVLDGNTITVQISGFGATALATGGGGSSTLSRSETYKFSNGMINANGAVYTKD
jgi:hypothetical protein